MGAERQFVVPTDGKPVRGLIQDAVVGGHQALLPRGAAETGRGGAAAVERGGPEAARGTTGRGCRSCALPPPAILKALPPGSLTPAAQGEESSSSSSPSSSPEDAGGPSWTGKQIIDGILAFVAAGRPPADVSLRDQGPGGRLARRAGLRDQLGAAARCRRRRRRRRRRAKRPKIVQAQPKGRRSTWARAPCSSSPVSCSRARSTRQPTAAEGSSTPSTRSTARWRRTTCSPRSPESAAAFWSGAGSPAASATCC